LYFTRTVCCGERFVCQPNPTPLIYLPDGDDPIGALHSETDARPYLILAEKSRNLRDKTEDRVSHTATSILEFGSTLF